ncbi:hypothetical protein IFM89_001141 [Coptis chinensis]|uniref:Uncharacterized protein n=1 Tax=Coptis chinensis TaxID=261450 RepID=A0A835IMQ3_9MAGN|nr:hypothetical protein IFM89_001141 [Coptis chinensis]
MLASSFACIGEGSAPGMGGVTSVVGVSTASDGSPREDVPTTGEGVLDFLSDEAIDNACTVASYLTFRAPHGLG